MYEVSLTVLERSTYREWTVETRTVDGIVDAAVWRRMTAHWAASRGAVLPDGFEYRLPLPRLLLDVTFPAA